MNHLQGYILAALAAAAYGTNPIFAIPLYEHGMNPNSVLLFRYLIGLPILACIMRIRGLSFALHRDQALKVIILGVLMALSSLTLFESYRYMNSGIASTLLFVYPIMVAVLMIFLYHEKFKTSLGICLLVMSIGLYLLMKPQGTQTLSLTGILLVMVSAGTYAIYIVLVNVSSTVRTIPTTKLLFYVLTVGTLFYTLLIPLGFPLTLPTGADPSLALSAADPSLVLPAGSDPTLVLSAGADPSLVLPTGAAEVSSHTVFGFGLPSVAADWLSLVALAIIPTVISLACTTRAIQLIGSTPTAIFGALEPVSAVILSVLILGQALTTRDIIGGSLIIIATTIVIADRPLDRLLLHVRKMFPRPHRER